MTTELYILCALALASIAIIIIWRCLLKMPSEKSLRDISDSITAESQKNRKAIEELTRAIRESKEK
ncbi:MAG: hypothetical protein M0Q48_09055 [Verrucomicrobia bacterium]|jgi:hypothetical protein|nr:hypothetical protein [Verrucomicrobiota bacterium]